MKSESQSEAHHPTDFAKNLYRDQIWYAGFKKYIFEGWGGTVLILTDVNMRKKVDHFGPLGPHT